MLLITRSPRSVGMDPPSTRLRPGSFRRVGALVALAAAQAFPAHALACQPVPADLVSGRFLVDFQTSTGTFRALTDTGGGGTILSRGTAERLSLSIADAPTEIRAELGPDVGLAVSPEVGPEFPAVPSPALVVSRAAPAPGWPEQIDAIVGHDWFEGRRWTWDYPAGTLALDCTPSGEQIPMTLPAPDAAPPSKQFPRFLIMVAGEPIAVLFDTGASTWLTSGALAALDDGGPAIRASSMIAASRIAAWRREHPDWRVIEAAQHGTGATMIEAPDVTIAGHPVGPVWFTERPDAVFARMLSPAMSGPVEGAVGGNAFRDLRITIDYRSQTGWVSKP